MVIEEKSVRTALMDEKKGFEKKTDNDELARLVRKWNSGDEIALDRLVDLLYDELRQIAHAHLKRERSSHTLNTTALVHEAYLQLSERTGPSWQGRPQFFAFVSRVMRNVLIDYARRRQAKKRGGQRLRVPLEGDVSASESEVFELLAVDQALTRLAERHERLARVAECRFFGGMPETEIAAALGISLRTVQRDWRRARAYLFTTLSEDSLTDGAEA